MSPRSKSRLIYDSARADALLGLRAAVFVNRTLVFQRGDISLDVVIQAGSGSNGHVHGQVIDAASNTPVPDARVRLRGSEPAVQTDELGQFAVAIAEVDGQLGLDVETETMRMHCVVPLAESYRGHSIG